MVIFVCKCIPDIEHMMQMGIIYIYIWTSKIRHGIQPARINTGNFNPAIMGIQTCKQLKMEWTVERQKAFDRSNGKTWIRPGKNEKHWDWTRKRHCDQPSRKNGDRQNADLSKNQVYWTGSWTIKHADSKQTPGLQGAETADWNKTHRAIFRDLNHQWYTCGVCCDVLQLIAIKHTETSFVQSRPLRYCWAW